MSNSKTTPPGFNCIAKILMADSIYLLNKYNSSLCVKVPHYLAAQYLGAFLASGAVFLVYWDALVWYEHDRGGYRVTPDTAAIFGTFPAHHLTLLGGLTDQLVATALLLLWQADLSGSDAGLPHQVCLLVVEPSSEQPG